MSYGIWLSYNNQEEGFQIPINPESIEIGDGLNGKGYDITGLGEINVIKNPKLTEYSFESFFPAVRYPFVSAAILLQPSEYVNYIKYWMETKRPIRFVFTGDSFDINEAVSIEAFDWKEVAGGGGDIEYSLKLKKYVFYSASKAVVVTKDDGTKEIQVQVPARQNERQAPETYAIKTGDTLYIIAKRLLGDGSKWCKIQEINEIPDDQLKKLPVGKIIKLPTEESL